MLIVRKYFEGRTERICWYHEQSNDINVQKEGFSWIYGKETGFVNLVTLIHQAVASSPRNSALQNWELLCHLLFLPKNEQTKRVVEYIQYQNLYF